MRQLDEEAHTEARRRARNLVADALQRVAASHAAETTVSIVELPSDDMKGRIIGREGRNIRTLEHLTGVDFIVDDTPQAVVLSSFDGIRREVAKLTLTKLLEDGRIHPARVEEMYYQSKAEVDDLIRQAGEQAVFEANCGEFHEELVKILGRLRYRTSYGQNVLKHTLEVVQLAGVMASELGASVKTAKRASLLHDLGKAVSHEEEGPHALISARYARRYGESQGVVHAIEAHHYEVQPQTVEAVLRHRRRCGSAARPGARGESLESYVKRLEALEELAAKRAGVERVYALQAGREIRVIVKPEEIADDEAALLSHEIAREIEQHLEYPGPDQGDGDPRVARDRVREMRRYHVTTFGCQMNAHDSERIRGMLEELGLGEAGSSEEADVLVFNTCTIREKPDQRLAAHLGNATSSKGAEPGHRRRSRRLLRGGSARAPVRAVPVHRRRLRPRDDSPPRGLARRGRVRRRAIVFRNRRGAPLLRSSSGTKQATVPGVGADLDGLQLGLRVLHRARGPRPGSEPPARRDHVRGRRCSRRRAFVR